MRPVAGVMSSAGAGLDELVDFVPAARCGCPRPSRGAGSRSTWPRPAGRRVRGRTGPGPPAPAAGCRVSWPGALSCQERTVTLRCWRSRSAVAHRYAGTLGDVLRLAIPPRHARAEANTRRHASEGPSCRSAARQAGGHLPIGLSFAAVALVARARADRAGDEQLCRAGVGKLLEGGRAAATLRIEPQGELLLRAGHRRRRPGGTRCPARCSARAGGCGTGRGPRARPIATRRSSLPHAATWQVVLGTRAAAFAPVTGAGVRSDVERRRRLVRRASLALPARPRGAPFVRRDAQEDHVVYRGGGARCARGAGFDPRRRARRSSPPSSVKRRRAWPRAPRRAPRQRPPAPHRSRLPQEAFTCDSRGPRARF